MIITVVPPIDVARKMAVANGLKVKTFHVTLAFLGSSADVSKGTVEEIKDVLRQITPPLPIPFTIDKLDRFQNVMVKTDPEGKMIKAEEPTDVIFANVVSKELYDFRQKLVEELDERGIYYSKLHKEFKAHISIIYVPHGEDIQPTYTLPLEGAFSEVSIWSDSGPIYTRLISSNLVPEFNL